MKQTSNKLQTNFKQIFKQTSNIESDIETKYKANHKTQQQRIACYKKVMTIIYKKMLIKNKRTTQQVIR
ncbi:hypothetical protein [Methanimicrococcus hongohii]|uniref:hypothetical protein n=1 Tax=Methanimicrococcus hongohii TaxID=3028295 RepID=UPI002931CDE0|nr:hypothetical protein [Methanimicrococcus sp. Hf6]